MTDEFLKVYLARPELIPPPEACAVERTLHGALLADPRMPVAAVRDRGDRRCRRARELADADRASATICCATGRWKRPISTLVRNGVGKTPPLFVNQLVHVILRNALDGVDEPACCAPPKCSSAPSA